MRGLWSSLTSHKIFSSSTRFCAPARAVTAAETVAATPAWSTCRREKFVIANTMIDSDVNPPLFLKAPIVYCQSVTPLCRQHVYEHNIMIVERTTENLAPGKHRIEVGTPAAKLGACRGRFHRDGREVEHRSVNRIVPGS